MKPVEELLAMDLEELRKEVQKQVNYAAALKHLFVARELGLQ